MKNITNKHNSEDKQFLEEVKRKVEPKIIAKYGSYANWFNAAYKKVLEKEAATKRKAETLAQIKLFLFEASNRLYV